MKHMEHPNTDIGHGNTYLMIATIVLTTISHFTLSDGAAIGAIVAALSTVLVNVAKYQETRRTKKNNPWKNRTP